MLRSVTDQIFSICQLLERKMGVWWDSTSITYGLQKNLWFSDDMNSFSLKLARLIKICLNKTYSKVQTGKNLSHVAPIQYGLKEVNSLEQWC
jgi:hypothetical protein